MKNLFQSCMPRPTVLDGTADFVVNLADLAQITKAEAKEFLDANVLTSGMEMLLSQAFARMAGTDTASGIYKLSESMGGGKTQSMIVAGILARFPDLAAMLPFHKPLAKAKLIFDSVFFLLFSYQTVMGGGDVLGTTASPGIFFWKRYTSRIVGGIATPQL
jgi:hypothetical protein